VEGEGVKTEVQVHGLSVEALEAMEQSALAAAKARLQGVAAVSPASPVKPAEVAAAAPGPAPAQAPAPETTLLPEMSLLPQAPPVNDSEDPTVRMAVCGLKTVTVTGKQALVECDFKGVEPARSYRLEMQSVGIDAGGKPAARWQPFTHATLQQKGTMVLAQMQELQPGMLYVVRLVGLNGHGEEIETSSAGEVWTPAEEKGWGWEWWCVGGVVAAGAGAWMWRRRGGLEATL
jgi:hypothetical protein